MSDSVIVCPHMGSALFTSLYILRIHLDECVHDQWTVMFCTKLNTVTAVEFHTIYVNLY